MAFALAGGRAPRLSVLAQTRSVAAMPFAGKFRLIDFTLSNCVNSELTTVAVLAQYAPLSLAAYVGRGEPWDLNRRDGGVTVLQPYVRQEGARWYEGTADALRQNLDVLENSGAARVFVLSTDLVYKMDYSWVLEHHWASRAEATLVAGRVPYGEVSRFGMLDTDPEGRILGFAQKPSASPSPWAFMGLYLFETAFLRQLLLDTRGADLIVDVLGPRLGRDESIRAYFYEGYWDDLGGVQEYHRAHRRLLEDPPAPDLYDAGWRIYARSEEMVPALFAPTARVEQSLFANGARVAGRVEHSVISPGVYVDEGAIVRDAVILNGARICENAVVEGAVIDKDVVVGPGARVGRITEPGLPPQITVIGKGAEIAAGAVVPPGSVVPVGPSAMDRDGWGGA
jgi:glucose-1-phosphate adenylyltransferase